MGMVQLNRVGIEQNDTPSNLKHFNADKLFIFEKVARKYLIHEVFDSPTLQNALIFTAHSAYDRKLESESEINKVYDPNQIKAIRAANDKIVKRIQRSNHYLFHSITPFFNNIIATKLDDGFLYIDILPYTFSNKVIKKIFVKDKIIYLTIKCNITNMVKDIPYNKNTVYQNITMEG